MKTKPSENGRERRSTPLGELGVVLERLLKFYTAMQAGKPVPDAGKNLVELGAALKAGASHVHGPKLIAASCATDQRDGEAGSLRGSLSGLRFERASDPAGPSR